MSISYVEHMIEYFCLFSGCINSRQIDAEARVQGRTEIKFHCIIIYSILYLRCAPLLLALT